MKRAVFVPQSFRRAQVPELFYAEVGTFEIKLFVSPFSHRLNGCVFFTLNTLAEINIPRRER